jgi:hypothetical protein
MKNQITDEDITAVKEAWHAFVEAVKVAAYSVKLSFADIFGFDRQSWYRGVVEDMYDDGRRGGEG